MKISKNNNFRHNINNYNANHLHLPCLFWLQYELNACLSIGITKDTHLQAPVMDSHLHVFISITWQYNLTSLSPMK